MGDQDAFNFGEEFSELLKAELSASIHISDRHPVHSYLLNGVDSNILNANLLVDLGQNIFLLRLKGFLLDKLLLRHLRLLFIFITGSLILFVESVELSFDLLHDVILVGQKEPGVDIDCINFRTKVTFYLVHSFFKIALG